MATYLYGLTLPRSAACVPAHIAGIGGGVVRVLDCGALAALVNSVDRAAVRATLAAVRAHDHALQAAVHHGATVAAARFGQAFASDAEARGHIVERCAHLGRLLEAYDGCVEMRLLLPRTPGSPGAPPPSGRRAGPGRAYLERIRRDRLAPMTDAAGETVRWRHALGPVVRAEHVELLPGGRGLVASHVVARDAEGEYRAAVASVAALADATVVGPLALHGFAERP